VTQTGDPVCQPVAVLLARIRDCEQRLGTAPQFAANMAALPACRAGGRATGQVPGPGAFIRGLSAGCGAVIGGMTPDLYSADSPAQ
jgi:hypothetical protein